MRWKIVLEGTDEFGSAHRSELTIDKDMKRLSAGEIGFSVEDGKAIMAHLQQVVVNQQCEAYVLTSRFCTDCEGFRRIKDYSKRKIRTVFGCVEVRNPRIMNCQRCLPHFCAAWTVLRDICPDQATPELMERSARLGSLLPYRKAAEVMAEFLPIKPTESFVTLRHRTLKLGERLDERARERAWFEPPSTTERRQIELNLPNDPEREFVVSIDTAHVRASRAEAGRSFEIVVARCGRGGRGSRPGRYFTTADTSKRELQSRTLQALQTEGYAGRGEVTVLSDGAEIMKRLPKALPQPTTHIIDCWCGRPPTASMCQNGVVADLRKRRPSVDQVSRIGMDTSKHIFQLHGINAAEATVLRKKLRRKEMVVYFEKLAPTVIAIEACGGSHHWARLLQSFGHSVKLIPPQLVKPYVKRGKNDAADAEALCEAMSRPTMRFVPVKTAEQQAALMLVGVRDRLIRTRTQLANAIRGFAAEFGLSAAKGRAHLIALLERIQADENLPALSKELFAMQTEEYTRLQTQIAEVDAKLAAWHRADECSQRLSKIPGVGPIGAVLLRMKTPDPKLFQSGRQFAAWIGLTPKDHSTAGKVRLGVITRAGDEGLRSVLVVGATSVILQVRRGGRVSPWLAELLKRKSPKLAAVALANKMARIAWKLMLTGETYIPKSAHATSVVTI